MRPAEVRDTGALLGTVLGEIAEVARDVHEAVAARVFGLVGPSAAPFRLLHDAISATAYGSSRLGVQVLPTMVGMVAARRTKPGAQSWPDTPRGHFAASALNGLWGDRLAEQRASLAPTTSVRTHKGPLRRKPRDVVPDLDAPSGRLVLFVHGLCESERSWWFGAEKNWGDPAVTYGSLLHTDRDWTPLYVHYNTGLHVSDSAKLITDYVEGLVAAWPVPVTEIAMVGHSMGGLVVRSVAHQAAARGSAWTAALRHVVGLGVPHLGAPLERWVNTGTRAMAELPETLPLATWLNRRSAGIKDLRHGALVEDDWAGADPDDPNDRCTPVALVAGVAYSMVSATLSRNPCGRFGHDLLVGHLSAHGMSRGDATRRIEFDADRLFHVGARTHFHLRSDRLVYEQLRSWLDGDVPGATPARDILSP